MRKYSFMNAYSFNVRRMSTKYHVINILLEDVVHWWILYPLLGVILEKGIVLDCASSLLFALGHIGRRPMEVVYESSFWLQKFPTMLIMGCIHAQINKINRLYVTLFHLFWNCTCLAILSMCAKSEQPGDWLLQLAAQHSKYPPPPLTEQEAAKHEEFRQGFQKWTKTLLNNKHNQKPRK